MDAAENVSVRFDAVSYNPATAMGAHRCQGVNCALEAVKRVVFPRNDYVESFVIFVFTNFASSHTKISRAVTFVAVFGWFGRQGLAGKLTAFPTDRAHHEVEMRLESDTFGGDYGTTRTTDQLFR